MTQQVKKKLLSEISREDRIAVLSRLMAQNLEWLNESVQWEEVYLTGIKPTWDDKDVVVTFYRYANVPVRLHYTEDFKPIENPDEWREGVERRLVGRGVKEANMLRLRFSEPQEGGKHRKNSPHASIRTEKPVARFS